MKLDHETKKYLNIALICAIIVLLAILFYNNYWCDGTKEKLSNIREKTVTLFYSPGCGHCTHFMPVWKEFSKKYDSDANFSTINCNENQKLCENVKGVPTIIFSKSNKKVDYSGERTLSSLVSFLQSF